MGFSTPVWAVIGFVIFVVGAWAIWKYLWKGGGKKDLPDWTPKD